MSQNTGLEKNHLKRRKPIVLSSPHNGTSEVLLRNLNKFLRGEIFGFHFFEVQIVTKHPFCFKFWSVTSRITIHRKYTCLQFLQ